jgi:hypothetical protein
MSAGNGAARVAVWCAGIAARWAGAGRVKARCVGVSVATASGRAKAACREPRFALPDYRLPERPTRPAPLLPGVFGSPHENDRAKATQSTQTHE